jgi:hypothetical protein
MNLLLERIQTSLLDLVGQFIQLLPGIAIALLLVLLTGYAAKVTQKMVGKMTKRLARPADRCNCWPCKLPALALGPWGSSLRR